jgi:TetR/AcrR family transcriptional repressor of nem operon
MPRDGRATRERILAAAQKLMIDNGYAATSVDQVIAASGSSKGAFFHHFESKRALADELVEGYVVADVAMLDEGLAAVREQADDPAERVIGFVRHFEDLGDEIMAGQTGCLYISILTEQQLIASGTSDPITKAVYAWRQGFADLLHDALPDRDEADVEALADHLFVTFEGAFLLARSTGDPAQMRTQLRILRLLITALVS